MNLLSDARNSVRLPNAINIKEYAGDSIEFFASIVWTFSNGLSWDDRFELANKVQKHFEKQDVRLIVSDKRSTFDIVVRFYEIETVKKYADKSLLVQRY